MEPQHLFLEKHPADAVRDRRSGRGFEIGDRFMPPRFVYSREAVYCQVKRLVVLSDGFVAARQQAVIFLVTVDLDGT